MGFIATIYQKLLFFATEKDSFIAVLSLLFKKVDINTQDNQGKTPLHIAIENGYDRLVNSLLNEEVDINIQDNRGKTPLHN
jgi:ankyrin repeat protein